MTVTHPTPRVEVDLTTNLATGTAFHEQTLVIGPYAYHRLKEASGTFADASGNGKTGTGTGTITYNQTGAPAITGDSGARHVVFTTDTTRIDFAGTTPTGNQLALTLRVYETDLSKRRVIFENDGSSLLKSLIEVWIGTDGSLNAQATDGAATATTAAGVIAINTAYTIGVVFDGPGQEIRFYKDGSLVSAHTWRTGRLAMASLAKLQLTWRWGTDSSSSQGSVRRIAEPAVFLRAPTATEFADQHAALAVTPFAGYAWTDLTPYVLFGDGVRRTFGRTSELDDVVSMTTDLTLKNDDRRFEIENAASPHYPFIVPGRPLRILMTQDGVTYDWAFGYIEDWPQDWDEAGWCGRVKLKTQCFLARLENEDIGTRDFTEQTAKARLEVLLNAAGQPTSMRDLDTGANTIMALTADANSVGRHAKTVARTDRGLLYFDQRGYATFDDANHRTSDARSTTAQGRLGPGGIPYRKPRFHAPLAFIRNEFTLRRPGGVDQIKTDQTSRNRYGKRSYSDELLLTTDAAMATRGATMLAAFKDPHLRVKEVSFNPAAPSGYWSHALGVRLGDRYTWVFNPRQGSSSSRDVFVEGVSDSYTNLVYESTWFLSLA